MDADKFEKRYLEEAEMHLSELRHEIRAKHRIMVPETLVPDLALERHFKDKYVMERTREALGEEIDKSGILKLRDEIAKHYISAAGVFDPEPISYTPAEAADIETEKLETLKRALEVGVLTPDDAKKALGLDKLTGKDAHIKIGGHTLKGMHFDHHEDWAIDSMKSTITKSFAESLGKKESEIRVDGKFMEGGTYPGQLEKHKYQVWDAIREFLEEEPNIELNDLRNFTRDVFKDRYFQRISGELQDFSINPAEAKEGCLPYNVSLAGKHVTLFTPVDRRKKAGILTMLSAVLNEGKNIGVMASQLVSLSGHFLGENKGHKLMNIFKTYGVTEIKPEYINKPKPEWVQELWNLREIK